jgi:hypothetical protein
MEKFYLYFQYRFGRDTILLQDSFSCMLGAYPAKHARDFWERFKPDPLKVQEICSTSGMQVFQEMPEERYSLLAAYRPTH